MAREFGGDLFDLSNMTDDEIRQVVIEHLREYPEVDAGWVDVDVKGGFVTLSGRVGTDAEVQIAEEVVHDVIGIQNYSNELVVVDSHRGQAPEAADEAVADNRETQAQTSGEGPLQQSDTADHLMEHVEEETHGTHDVQAAIRDGTAYIPPDRPTGDGYGSREDH